MSECAVKAGGGALTQIFAVPLRSFKIAQNDHHQIVKVVRNSAAELADGFQTLGGKKLILNFRKFFLCLLPLGDVSRHLCESNQTLIPTANSIDNHRCPE